MKAKYVYVVMRRYRFAGRVDIAPICAFYVISDAEALIVSHGQDYDVDYYIVATELAGSPSV